MSNLDPPAYKPNQTTKVKLNLHLDMKALKLFLTTGSGWITRKASELATVAGAAAAGYVAAAGEHAGATADQTAQASQSAATLVTVALVVAAKWGLDLLVSKLADTGNKELPPPATK